MNSADHGLPAADQRRLARLASFLERHGLLLHGVAATLLLAMFAAAAHFLTVEADEAWILFSAANAFGVPLPPTSALDNPTVATGGAYLLIHGLLARITMALWVHRAVSLLASVALLALVFNLLRRLGNPAGRAMAGAALVAAMPGFALQAGMATGEVLAALLLIAAGAHWARVGSSSTVGSVATGLLLGLACATRINCAAALPAIVAYALAAPHPTWARLRRGAIAAIVAGAFAALMVTGYTHVAATTDQQAYLSASTGIGATRKSVLQFVQNLSIANAQLPLFVVLAIACRWLVRRMAERPAPRPDALVTDTAGVLLFQGLAILAAWVVVAPLPHLRYLWPAIACCWSAGVLLLLQAWQGTRQATALVAMHLGVSAACAYALLTGGLAIASGESLVLVYQQVGLSPRTVPDTGQRFRAAADQRAVAAFMAEQGPDARFFDRQAASGYPLTYLSGRPVLLPSELDGGQERFLVLQPADYAIWRPAPAFDAWRHNFAREVFRSGDVSVWQVAAGAPPPPPGLFIIGQNDLY